MGDSASYRIGGYITTILLHVSNSVYMASGLEAYEDLPELKSFAALQPRYFTCWNFGLQVIYAFIALFCEILTLRNANNKKYTLNKHLRALRDILFAGILFPSTMLVFSLFWSLYLIDRDLIFPKYADKVLTPLSNHVIHTLIVPIVLWEIAFRPRHRPKSHKRNLTHLMIHLIVYLMVLTYTYIERGMWIYPILTKFYGTIYFPATLLLIAAISLRFYFLQWTLTELFWGVPTRTDSHKDS